MHISITIIISIFICQHAHCIHKTDSERRRDREDSQRRRDKHRERVMVCVCTFGTSTPSAFVFVYIQFFYNVHVFWFSPKIDKKRQCETTFPLIKCRLQLLSISHDRIIHVVYHVRSNCRQAKCFSSPNCHLGKCLCPSFIAIRNMLR